MLYSNTSEFWFGRVTKAIDGIRVFTNSELEIRKTSFRPLTLICEPKETLGMNPLLRIHEFEGVAVWTEPIL